VIRWLKESCTREGASYWLFKGEHDDELTLYDMSDLPARIPSEYSLTVAIVCLRLAPTVGNRVARRELLLRAVRPLNMSAHPAVFAAVHECIAETFVEIGDDGVRGHDSIEADTFVLPSGDFGSWTRACVHVFFLRGVFGCACCNQARIASYVCASRIITGDMRPGTEMAVGP
jgi:hypothetical protein